MANLNGATYGLTLLSPILRPDHKGSSPVDRLRDALRDLPGGMQSPFCRVTATHQARLSIIEDVFFVGTPAREDHLQSEYLWFNSNFDGELAPYLDAMFTYMPGEIEAIWQHCVAFPGISAGRGKWQQYMLKCQVKTTFFFAAVNDMTVEDMLRALMLKQEFSRFVAENQGRDAADLQRNFRAFMAQYRAAPTPGRGSICYEFDGLREEGDRS